MVWLVIPVLMEKTKECHVNLESKACIDIGEMNLPQDVKNIDIIMDFNPDEAVGTITVNNTGEVWSYNMDDASLPTLGTYTDIVDKKKFGSSNNRKRIKLCGRTNWLMN